MSKSTSTASCKTFLRNLTILIALILSINVSAQQKVVGGVDVEIKDYPWQVALTSSPNGSGFCGGSIIGDSWVLTAAHCVNGDSPSSLYIRCGALSGGFPLFERQYEALEHHKHNLIVVIQKP